jgi:hypothetical protein
MVVLVAQLAILVDPIPASARDPRPDPAAATPVIRLATLRRPAFGPTAIDPMHRHRGGPASRHRWTEFAAVDSAESEDPESAGDEAAGKPDAPALNPLAGPESEETEHQRPSWWIWTGTAALVGLFVAGLSYDLSHDDRPPRIPDLPWFPNAP